MSDAIRTFETGATRDTDIDKPDYEGFLSPLALASYGRYMTKHRKQADGQIRDSDNWQKGIPPDQYIKSAFRHFIDWWSCHRGYGSQEGLEDALCALLFNVQGYLHEVCKAERRVSNNSSPPLTIKGNLGGSETPGTKLDVTGNPFGVYVPNLSFTLVDKHVLTPKAVCAGSYHQYPDAPPHYYCATCGYCDKEGCVCYKNNHPVRLDSTAAAK